MPLVYRFENTWGRGPWTGGGSYAYDDNHKCRDKMHSCNDMSTPSDPSEGAVHDHWGDGTLGGLTFGFTSLKQLKKAFPSGLGRAAMAGAGQSLKVFEVPDAFLSASPSQCVFNPEKARYVKTLDLKTLKPLEV